MNVISWKPRDTFSYLKDGTSNQLVFGEKTIPSFALNSTKTTSHKLWDGGYFGLRPTAWVFNVVRHICPERYPCLSRGPNDSRIEDTDPDLGANGARYGFGSSHNGIVNFAIGDGSVHAMSITTSDTLMFNLGCVDDGNAVTLP
jgi:hypothetical protein